jgi:hypothetical protein
MLDGKTEEARRKADDLAKRYPGNPAVLAARQTTLAGEQASSARRYQAETGRRQTAVTQDVSRSSTPPLTEMEYPSDWSEKTRRRAAASTLTEKEKAIVNALNSRVNVDFKDAKFEEVITYLRTLTNQNILVDQNALAEAQVTYTTPITVQAKGLSVRMLLRRALADLNLTYVVKDQAIQVTSTVRAKELMVVRTYYIGDLLGNGGINSYLGTPLGGDFRAAEKSQQVSQIIDMVQTSVDPPSWDKAGGSGTITFNPATMSLIIRQSAEVHAMLGSQLGR